MSSNYFRRCLAAIVLIGLAVPSFAHRSSANYDSQREIVLKGVVTSWPGGRGNP
jgi:hypothetical protein